MSGPASLGNRSVLIVDDEPRLRDMLTRAVGELGYVATAVRSAEMALREIGQGVPALVLLDINLPGMDGLEFLQALRRESSQTQVVILTGFGSLDAAKQAFQHDVVDFLTKPCSLAELERALSRAEQRRRLLLGLPSAESAPATPTTEPLAPPVTLEEIERAHILTALERNQHNRAATAAELGISERTLYYRLSRYQAEEPHLPQR